MICGSESFEPYLSRARETFLKIKSNFVSRPSRRKFQSFFGNPHSLSPLPASGFSWNFRALRPRNDMSRFEFQEKINASSNRGRRRTLFFNLLSLISLRRRARVILSGTSADGNWIKLPSTLFPALPRSLLGYLGKELPIFRLARFPSFGRGFPSAGEKKERDDSPRQKTFRLLHAAFLMTRNSLAY